MPVDHLMFFSIPGLRPGDIDRTQTPTLYAWADRGAPAELIPTFPCVTSPVQATMWTGLPPGEHGVIGNGFFHRDRREVAFWVARNDVIAGEPIWDALRRADPAATSAVWHAQNIKGAGADFIVTPAPIHEPDGTTKLWCYTKPDGLYESLLAELGHFPLQHYWGPLANIESTRWILSAAAWLHEHHAPRFHWIYVPHLDYAAQKFGPDSNEARRSLVELDHELGAFAQRVEAVSDARTVVYLAVGEYALTDVTGVVYPNRILRDAGLLAVRPEDGGEVVDPARSRALAMVDHQFAHVFVLDERKDTVNVVAELFRDEPGIAGVFDRARRAEVGLDHERSGDIVLIAEDTHWFAYYWWLNDQDAPRFARTVDIHRKPGYDPVELFFDPDTKTIPLRAGLVKGSHGVPATSGKHAAALLCSSATRWVQPGRTYRDVDVKHIALGLLSSAPNE